MVEMSCMEHDKYVTRSQFVTHMMGRVLEKFGLESSPINTKGYESSLNLVENTKRDSFDLLFMYNQNVLEQFKRLDMAFESIKKELFKRLHQVYRKHLFGDNYGRVLFSLGDKLLGVEVYGEGFISQKFWKGDFLF
ncbi:hypothetical protein CRYUN_Cryun26dG0100400 [Craigia yunnanensis]